MDNESSIDYGPEPISPDLTTLGINLVAVVKSDPRIFLVGSVAEYLQTGYTLSEALARANDIDVVIAESRFPHEEIDLKYELARKIRSLGNAETIFSHPSQEELEQCALVNTEFGHIRVATLKTIAVSNVDSLLTDVRNVANRRRTQYEPLKIAKKLERQIAFIKDESVVKQAKLALSFWEKVIKDHPRWF